MQAKLVLLFLLFVCVLVNSILVEEHAIQMHIDFSFLSNTVYNLNKQK